MNNTISLPLTRGLSTLIDAADYEAISQFKWLALNRGKWGYAAARRRRVSEPGTSQWVLLHRFLVACPAHLQVDHINRNPLDNRRANLRICTAMDNLANRRPWGASGYKGVYQVGRRWTSRIRTDGAIVTLGSFDSPEAAAAAYDAVALAKHGEFAHLNLQVAA